MQYARNFRDLIFEATMSDVLLMTPPLSSRYEPGQNEHDGSDTPSPHRQDQTQLPFRLVCRSLGQLLSELGIRFHDVYDSKRVDLLTELVVPLDLIAQAGLPVRLSHDSDQLPNARTDLFYITGNGAVFLVLQGSIRRTHLAANWLRLWHKTPYVSSTSFLSSGQLNVLSVGVSWFIFTIQVDGFPVASSLFPISMNSIVRLDSMASFSFSICPISRAVISRTKFAFFCISRILASFSSTNSLFISATWTR